MSVKIPVPCSIYDIRGVEEWLDEMALKGLFLKEVNSRFDRAVFELRDPAPVRYRLDPITRKGKEDDEHLALYAQMGWNYVDRVARWYYIFSCADPDAPELYTDPQSLALAMSSLVRRDFRNHVLFALALFAVIPFMLLFPTPGYNFRNLLLWERPRDVFFIASYPFLLVLCLPMLVLEYRRTRKIRDTLAQGLPLKAGKRRNKLPWYVIWALIYIPLSLLPRLLFPSVGWEVCGLDEIALSHPWPTAAQIEQLGAAPLTEEPAIDGYVLYNDSPFAPVQEEVNRYRAASPVYLSDLSVTIRYIRAGPPKIARWLYQMELDQKFKELEDRQSPRYTARITELAPFAPQERPGLDRLEVTRYKERGEDSWTFALLRGKDVLLVDYTGSVRWENCLPLFLEALDKEVTA